MAACARLIARSEQIAPVAMFHVTVHTLEYFRLFGVMEGPIVAAETSLVGHFRRKLTSLLQVTRRTFLFKNSMSF